jgi:hypothetical protein
MFHGTNPWNMIAAKVDFRVLSEQPRIQQDQEWILRLMASQVTVHRKICNQASNQAADDIRMSLVSDR